MRRTEVSARAIERASSDPTAVKPTNKAKKAPCGGVCGGGRSGVGGAKGGGQGEYAPAKHVPGTEPDKRDTGAGTHTAGGKQIALPFGPEVGAVCGKAARTVLCGGRTMKRASLALLSRFVAGSYE